MIPRMRRHIIRLSLLALVAALGVSAQVSTQANASTQTSAAAQTQPRKKLLFLTYPGVAYHQSLDPAEQAVAELGKAGGFDVTVAMSSPLAIQESTPVRPALRFLAPKSRAGVDQHALEAGL